MKVKASLKNYRRSASKVREVTRVLAGLDVNQARVQLEVINKGSAKDLKKLIESAMANAENNFGLDKNNLYISEITVDAGASMKRWLPRAYGKADQILKRTCKINLTLDEKVAGKKKVAKKEKKETVTAEAKIEKESPKEEKKEVKNVVPAPKSVEKVGEKKASGNFTKKVFRRKSM